MISRLYEINVQGSRIKVYVIQQELDNATLKEHNMNICEFNEWLKTKNREITKAVQKNIMKIQQLIKLILLIHVMLLQDE